MICVDLALTTYVGRAEMDFRCSNDKANRLSLAISMAAGGWDVVKYTADVDVGTG